MLLLTASVGIALALVKSIGALAMLMPAAFQMAKKNDTSLSVFLMPMASASLLGGLITLVGTAPNIIVSRVRERLGVSKRSWLPIGILAVAMSATAMGFVPVTVAFFAAAGLIMATGVRPCARRTTMSNGQS